MTKEQLTQLTDDVRIPTEILLEKLRSSTTLPIQKTAATPDGGIAFFFSRKRDDEITMTADIEIYPDGSASASVIPYVTTNEGQDVFQSEFEPIELWDIEEEPPFDETLRHIHERFGLVSGWGYEA